MRHRGTSPLLSAEKFLRLANFRALQVAYFHSDFFKRRGNQGQGAHVMRVAVALNHLRGDARHLQAQPLADFLFDLRAKVRSVAHRAGNFAVLHAA